MFGPKGDALAATVAVSGLVSSAAAAVPIVLLDAARLERRDHKPATGHSHSMGKSKRTFSPAGAHMLGAGDNVKPAVTL